MKTITLLFIMFPLFFLMAQKQVLIDGGKAGDFYYKGDAKSGNLGIGIKEPTEDLHIKKSRASMSIENTNASDWAFLRIKGTGSHFWDIAQFGDNSLLEFRPKGVNAKSIVFHQNGNVGIGSRDPKQKLEVDGSINLGLNRSDDKTRTNFQGNKLHFLGANENSDPLWMGRYNIESNISELRVNIGDDPEAKLPMDKFVIGTTTPKGKDGKWAPKFTVRSDGNVGIGTIKPKERLEVNGNVSVLGDLKMSGKDSYIWTNGTGTGYTGIWDQKNKRVLLYTTEATGNVGIGTKTPDMKLTVNGKVHAKGMRIDTTITADYVFEKFYTGTSKLNPNYKMPTLKEVEAFTKKHHHLPEIPSVKEVRKQGLIVEDMTILMLQKIEELTLYTIQQEKRITNLEAKNNKLQNENNALKTIYKRLDKLEKAQGVRKN